MLLKKYIVVVLLGVVLFIQGCGFHLKQNYQQFKNHYPKVAIDPYTDFALSSLLRQTLKANNIEVINKPTADVPTIQVSNYKLSSHPYVYGPDGELRRERLTLNLTFVWQQNNQQTLLPLATFKERHLNTQQYLGDNAEKNLIILEMQKEIIHQFLRHMEHIS